MEENKQHVQLPKRLETIKDLEPKDQLIYCALKRHGTQNCWPSLKTISQESGASINTVRKSIKKLVDVNYITVEPHGKKGQQYKFNPYKNFEPFSYEFLDRKDLSFTVKSYLIAAQQFMIKNEIEGEGKISYSNQQLSEKINMPATTIRDCNRELIDKHFMTIVKNECINPVTGCKNDTKIIELNSLGQAIVWTLAAHDEKLNQQEDRLTSIEERLAQYEKRIEATEKENQALKKENKALKKEVQEKEASTPSPIYKF